MAEPSKRNWPDDRAKRETEQDDLLSIGDFACLGNIDKSSLRYYDKIGILKPAYINPENGYRYYKSDQLNALEFVTACIKMGISLAEVRTRIDEQGNIDLLNFFKQAFQTVSHRMTQLEHVLQNISICKRCVEDCTKIGVRDSLYLRHVPQRWLATIPLDEGDEGFLKRFVKCHADLDGIIENADLAKTSLCGALFPVAASSRPSSPPREKTCYCFTELGCWPHGEVAETPAQNHPPPRRI